MSEPENLVNLTWQQRIRLRPGLYFGGGNDFGLQIVLSYVLNHMIDDTMSNMGGRIDIDIRENDVVCLNDEGPGLPVSFEAGFGKRLLEYIVEGEFYRYLKPPSPNMRPSNLRCLVQWSNTYSLSWVNAASAELDLLIRRDGFLWHQTFQAGVKQTELEQVRPLNSGEPTGTTITFRPDPLVFENNSINYGKLMERCRELAFLFPDMIFNLRDQRPGAEPRTHRLSYPNGLGDFVSYLNREYVTLHDPVVVSATVDSDQFGKPLAAAMEIDLAFQYADTHQSLLLTYLNGDEMSEGGTHISGLVRALERVFPNVKKEDILDGLTAVVSIWHPHPIFEPSAIPRQIINPELEDATYDLVVGALETFVLAHPEQMQKIRDKLSQNSQVQLRRRYGENADAGPLNKFGS